MFTASTIERAARTAGLAGLAVLVTANVAVAQDPPSRPHRWELRIPTGALVTTGSQRDNLKNARLGAIQLSWLVQPRIAVTGTFGWARSRDITTSDNAKLDIFSSDIGIEARSHEWFASAPISLSAFVGAGAGSRSYNYVTLDVPTMNNLAGYAAAGGEVGMGRIALRVEARNYTASFKPLVNGGESVARNDVVIMAGLRFNRRPSEVR